MAGSRGATGAHGLSGHFLSPPLSPNAKLSCFGPLFASLLSSHLLTKTPALMRSAVFSGNRVTRVTTPPLPAFRAGASTPRARRPFTTPRTVYWIPCSSGCAGRSRGCTCGDPVCWNPATKPLAFGCRQACRQQALRAGSARGLELTRGARLPDYICTLRQVREPARDHRGHRAAPSTPTPLRADLTAPGNRHIDGGQKLRTGSNLFGAFRRI